MVPKTAPGNKPTMLPRGVASRAKKAPYTRPHNIPNGSKPIQHPAGNRTIKTSAANGSQAFKSKLVKSTLPASNSRGKAGGTTTTATNGQVSKSKLVKPVSKVSGRAVTAVVRPKGKAVTKLQCLRRQEPDGGEKCSPDESLSSELADVSGIGAVCSLAAATVVQSTPIVKVTPESGERGKTVIKESHSPGALGVSPISAHVSPENSTKEK